MIKDTILLTFLIACFSFKVNAKVEKICIIESYDKIVHQSQILDYNFKVIKKSDCASKVKSMFRKFVSNFNGSLYERYFNSIVRENNKNIYVKLVPRIIEIISLKEHLKNIFRLKRDHEMKEISISNLKKAFLLEKTDSIYFKCDDCRKVGNKNIEVTVVDKYNKQKSEWINATLKVKTRVLLSKRDINYNEKKLVKNDFELGYIYTIRPEQYYSNLNSIIYYRLNKSVPASFVVKSSDLVPQILVKYGHPVSISLKSKGLTLTGKAIPAKSGKFNEIIKLKTIPKNKLITGRVINFNKVVIEL